MGKCKIVIVGSGIIGAGLAANALLNGHPTAIYSSVSSPDKAKARIQAVLDSMVEAGAILPEAVNPALDLCLCTNDLAEAVTGAALVQECSPERLDLKQSIYRQIQEVCGPKTVIASSTSTMMPSVLQEGALYPQSILVGHPYNPSYLLPLIEVCGGKETSQETIDSAMEIYKSMGKVPLLCRKEVPGFLVNKLSWGVMDVAKQLVMDDVCTVEDIDKAIMFGPGMRMAVTGQILTMSMGIQGGLRAAAAKYGKEPSEEDCTLADGVDQALANRPEAWGNDEDSVARFRDRMFTAILKEQGML